MRAWILVSLALLPAVVFAACGSGNSANSSSTVLKDLHDPKLAPTATPPSRLPTPLVANSVPGAAGGVGSLPSTYVVKSGDTFGAIASTLGVSTDELAKANPDVTNTAAIQVGQQLKVPRPGASPSPTPGAGPPLSTPAPGSTSTSGGGQIPPTGGAPSGGGAVGTPAPGAAASAVAGGPGTTYVVKAGDSACAIAISSGVSLQELADANGMTKDQIAKLSINQALKVPPRTGHSGC